MIESVVYFIERGGSIKIGYSTNLAHRLRVIPGTLLGYVDGGLAEEAAFHQRFKDLRIRGEWFRNESPLTEFIQTLPAFEPVVGERGRLKFPNPVMVRLTDEQHFRLEAESMALGVPSADILRALVNRQYGLSDGRSRVVALSPPTEPESEIRVVPNRKFLLAMSPELFGRVEAYAKDHEQSVTDVLRMATVQFLAATPPVTVAPREDNGDHG